MCTSETFYNRAAARIGGFFSTPTLAKGALPIGVAGMDFAGLTLGELVQLLTLIYTALLILGAIPKAIAGIQALKDRFRSKGKEEE